jgi:hypothetical protein
MTTETISRWESLWHAVEFIGFVSFVIGAVLFVALVITYWDEIKVPMPGPRESMQVDPYETREVPDRQHDYRDDGPVNVEHQIVNTVTNWIGCAASQAEAEEIRRELARAWYQGERRKR